ncbi:hypothetical protein B5807_12041 [Epicoccum nigrum]|uniref:Uncharacterized protein n=1 Tax=Epicoccum nigrum TaxID=105696 RepID=A0A1Y2LII5_EPING|nr:hypothetical protein B5807_12041 [Epicoccum nigrum]
MQPIHRVQKRSIVSNHTKRKGRPPKCTESWKKKLILLRMCGLDARQVVAVLTMQGGGAAKTKPRRAQQLVKQLLVDNQERFHTPDKLVARRHATFIRTSLRSDGSRNPRSIKRQVKAMAYKASQRDSSKSSTCQHNETGGFLSSPGVTQPLFNIGADALSTDASPVVTTFF